MTARVVRTTTKRDKMTPKEICQLEIRYTRQELSQRCKTLTARLETLCKRLDSDTPDDRLNINSLGEIQSEGTIIDAICGRLAAKISLLYVVSKGCECSCHCGGRDGAGTCKQPCDQCDCEE